MGFFSKLTGAVLDVALTPVTIVKDVVTTVVSEDKPEQSSTEKTIDSAGEKLGDALTDLAEGDL